MKRTYLEVTYRKGKPLAAYLYLPRQDGDRSHRSEKTEGGLIVDYSMDDRAIGIEIKSPSTLDFAQLNRLLVRLGLDPVTVEDLRPLVAA